MAGPAPSSTQASRRIELIVLGDARLERVGDSGTEVLFTQGKPLALVAFLAAAPRRTASRERLADLLWGDRDPEESRRSLRQALWMVNRAAGPEFIESHADGLTITASIDRDVVTLEQSVRTGDLDAAVDGYTGDFFADFAAPGADEFERWASVERARLRALFVHAAESLARRALDRGRFSDALTLARRVRERAPHDETGWQLLLESLSASGDVIGARAEADHFDEWLRSEERTPEPASVAALRVARNARPQQSEHASPAELAAELVGREKEFSQLHDLWEHARTDGARTADSHVRRARVALMLGDGGIGKSRLAADLRTRILAGRGRVAWCGLAAGDRQLAYASLASIAAALAAFPGAAGISEHSAAALLALDPALSSFFRGTPDLAQGEEALRRRGLALQELIAAVADDAPLALVVDDLHWCDDESLRTIAFVASHLRDERVLLVLTTRQTRALPPLGDAVTTIRLGPLGDEQVEQLVTSIAWLPDEPWARSLPRLLRRCTAGVPLLVLEALRLAMEQQVLRLEADGWTCRSAEELERTCQQGAVVGRRLGVLSPAEKTVLRVIAAAEVAIGADVIATASGLDAALATTTAIELERRGLVATAGSAWRVAHDEIAAAAIALAEPMELRAIQRGLGEARAAQSDVSSRRRAVRHFVIAEDWDRAATVAGDVLADKPRRGPLDGELRALFGDDVPPERLAEMRNALPAAVRSPGARRAALIAAGLIGAVALGALAMTRLGAHVAPEAQLFVVWSRADGSPIQVERADIALEGWMPGRPLEGAVREPVGAWKRTPFSGSGARVISPDGEHWASEVAFPDSGGLDVVLYDRTGTQRRLTFARGDDHPAAFSPDGTLLAIATGRWNANGHANLALIDARTGKLVRRLTQGDRDSEFFAHWSPDGSRLAFNRGQPGVDSSVSCWVTVDATRERCFNLAPWLAADPAGFVDDTHVLMSGFNASGHVSLIVDMTNGEFSRVEIPSDRRRRVDPSGRWLLVSAPDTGQLTSMLVGPSLAFERARPVVIREVPGAHADAWLASGPPDYIESVRIAHPRVALSVGVPHHLRVQATTRTGTRIQPPLLFWRALTPRIASVDSTGVIVALDTGFAIVEASAGGWRSSIDTIQVVRSATALASDERWQDGVPNRWRFYGDPLPMIVEDERGRRAFFNNGDSQFYSGAYSKGEYDATKGLAIDANFSAPLTSTQWQLTSVSLMAAEQFEGVEKWDHKTGYLPSAAGDHLSCSFVYPQGEGPAARTRANAANPLPATLNGRPLELWRGAWHVVRVQSFPDGSCGYAIDGVPVAIHDQSLKHPSTARVVLQGMSVGTRMLVGEVRVFTGIAPGIDWTRVKRTP